MVAKKKGAGGNLSRSQIVTVRLDPKLKFAAELAARKQRRTISSFIEWAIELAIRQVDVAPSEEHVTTVDEAVMNVWDVEEPDRMVKLAAYYPQLLSYEEEKIWKIIREYQPFWDGSGIKLGADVINIDLLRCNWETLQNIVAGEATINDLSPYPPPPLPQL